MRINKSSGVWAVLGQSSSAAVEWLLVLVLARQAPAEILGQYSLALAVATPVFLFLSLRLRNVFVTDLSGRARDYFMLRLFSVVVAVATLLAITLTLPVAIRAALVAVTATKAAEWISDICYGVPHRAGDMQASSAALLLRSILGVATFVGVYAFSSDLLQALWARALVVALFMVVDIHRFVQPEPENRGAMRAITELCRVAWPLGLVASLDSTLIQLPRLFLGTRSLAAVGYFSTLAVFPMLCGLVLNAFFSASLPRLRGGIEADDRGLVRRSMRAMLTAAMGMSAVGVLGAFVQGEAVLRLLYGASFASLGQSLVYFMSGATFWHLATVLGLLADGFRRFSLQLVAALVAVGGTSLLLFTVSEVTLNMAIAAFTLGMFLRTTVLALGIVAGSVRNNIVGAEAGPLRVE